MGPYMGTQYEVARLVGCPGHFIFGMVRIPSEEALVRRGRVRCLTGEIHLLR